MILLLTEIQLNNLDIHDSVSCAIHCIATVHAVYLQLSAGVVWIG